MIPSVYAVGEGERIHAVRGASKESDSSVKLEALRGETVAFQVVVEALGGGLDDVTVDAAELQGRADSLPIDAYVEHFVPIVARSRNERDASTSLAWTAEARPPDDDVGGWVPDALIPLSIASCSAAVSRAFCPYPMHIEAGHVGAVWLDVFVPDETQPGVYATRVVASAKGHPIGSVDVELTVRPAHLPDSAVSFFAYYSYQALEERFQDTERAERSVWQVLHAHHVDAFPALATLHDVDRIHGALTGEWFTTENGYWGAGEGNPPEIVPIGAYGSLGEPTEEGVAKARALSLELGALGVETFLYAADEECGSARISGWKRALRGEVRVGETCDRDPSREPGDIVMVPANAFASSTAKAARAKGKDVFVYNGSLPFAGPLVIDAPLPSLTANGWIAASYDVGRWFIWETTFWNDDNRGGRGPRDVFADAETFHNAAGDASLGDGLLLYPGRMPGWPEHSLETDEVIPSMRLKALRRGVEDAGLLALAASVDRGKALEIDRRVVRAALDDVSVHDGVQIELDPKVIANARADLRRLIAGSDRALDRTAARESRNELRKAREARSPLSGRFGAAVLVVGLCGLLLLALARLRGAPPRA